MGAVAPCPHWIPEDDILLKNAVEAGASLESLAKGAVRFSRRFTIRELQDRWHSLLYDPDISAEASARIVEIELSVSNLPRPNRSCSFKGKGWMLGKRKADSVRSHYYAMRKRNCHEPCNTFDLDLLVSPSAPICNGNESGYQEQLKVSTVHPVENCMPGEGPISNDFGYLEAHWAIAGHAFPQLARANVVSPLKDDLHNGMMTRDCLYGFPENVSSLSVNEAGGNGSERSFDHDPLHKDIPQILGENLAIFQNCSSVGEIRQRQTLTMGNLFASSDNSLDAKSLPPLDPMNDNHGNVCPVFEGNRNFGSPVSDCNASFNQLEYSSPLPSLSIWRAMEDIRAPTMPIEANLEDKDNKMGDSFALPGNTKKMSSPEYVVVHRSEPKLGDGLSVDVLNSSSVISDRDLMDLPGSLLNFENEEGLLYMDEDEKDMINRSSLDGVNSILVSSPNDGHRDDMPNPGGPQMAPALDACLVLSEVACHGELDGIGSQLHPDHGLRNNVCHSKTDVPATSSQNSHLSEFLEGCMNCTLNTEDPEIPCNDDLFLPAAELPPLASSAMQQKPNENSFSSAGDFRDNQKANEEVPTVIKEEYETPAQSTMASLVLSKMGSKHTSEGHPVKTEFPENNSLELTSRRARAIEKSAQGSDRTKSYTQNTIGGYKLEANMPLAVQKHALSPEELVPGEMGFSEPVASFSISDPEVPSESDDVPYFSDIEAMILDMDLDPYDEETNFTREVLRYQHEDTKKEIIRLERGAHSCMQRAIASHGALAVFYGRRLRHYIKKSEVLLGRATKDDTVDIDLGREGRANKISRRQAIIKLEKDGSFYLKNLGKKSIFVNSKEVATGQRFHLSPSCLIEIRGMRFMFEMKRDFGRQNTTASVAKMKSRQERNT